MRDNALTDKLGDRNARFYGFLSNYPAYDTAGTSHRYPEIQLQPVGSLWGVHFFGEEKMNQKTHHKIPNIVLLELHSGSCLSTLGDVAGTESRDFLDLGLPVELGFIPPAYGFMSRPGKRSGGVKKETLQQVPGKTGGAGNLNNPEGAPNMNILVSFSHSEVQPGEEIPDGEFLGSFLFTQKGTSLLWIISNTF